jgi:hypothetical protein
MAKSAKSAFNGNSKRDEEEYKPVAFYDRPHSASNTEKRKSKGLLNEAIKRGTHPSLNIDELTNAYIKPTLNGNLSRKQQ